MDDILDKVEVEDAAEATTRQRLSGFGAYERRRANKPKKLRH